MAKARRAAGGIGPAANGRRGGATAEKWPGVPAAAVAAEAEGNSIVKWPPPPPPPIRLVGIEEAIGDVTPLLLLPQPRR